MKNKHPFTCPPSYFENLESEILSEVNLLKYKKEGNAVSDTYFDKLENEILSKTVGKKQKSSSIKIYSKIWFRSAAAITGFGIISLFAYHGYQPKDKFADISNEEIAAYLESQPIESTQLTNALDDNSINELNKSVLNISDVDLKSNSRD